MTIRKDDFLALAIFMVPQGCLIALAAISTQAFHGKDLLNAFAFLSEGAFFGFVILALAKRESKRSRILALVVAVAYFAVLSVQFLSYRNGYTFLPPLAFENRDNIRLLMTWGTASTFAVAGFYAVAACMWLLRLPAVSLGRPRAAFLAFPMALSILLPTVAHTPSAGAMIAPPTTPPVQAFIRTLSGHPSSRSASQIPADMFDLAHLADMTMKPHAYVTEPVRKEGGRPHVILIFAEGISARAIGHYDGTFEGLTPHIDAFAAEPQTFAFRNYYNHTAATYRGILGQLCSTYPATIPHDAWASSHTERLTCLTDLLRTAGYTSAFIDPHDARRDHLHEMLSQLRFDEIVTASDFTDADAFESGRFAANDRDAFGALIASASAWTPETPQFLSIYLFGTHAWYDAPEGGARYGDGRNPVLNTVHEFDAAFGEFWQTFRASPAYDDTVVILTTDHARYPEASYLDALASHGVTDYQRVFADRIPFIVHDPREVAREDIDARHATSLDLAPTLAHYLGLPNAERAFAGTSIFERTSDAGLVNFDRNFHIVAEGRVHDITEAEGHLFDAIRDGVDALHARMTKP